MALTTLDNVIAQANFGKKIDPTILTPHLDAAEIELRRLLGSTLYDTIAGYKIIDENTEGYADKQATFKEVELAERYLTASLAVHALNTETQGNGIVRSTGFDQSLKSLLSRAEVNDLSQHYRDKAMALIAPYIPAATIPEDDEDGLANDIDTGAFYLGSI